MAGSKIVQVLNNLPTVVHVKLNLLFALRLIRRLFDFNSSHNRSNVTYSPQCNIGSIGMLRINSNECYFGVDSKSRAKLTSLNNVTHCQFDSISYAGLVYPYSLVIPLPNKGRLRFIGNKIFHDREINISLVFDDFIRNGFLLSH